MVQAFFFLFFFLVSLASGFILVQNMNEADGLLNF